MAGLSPRRSQDLGQAPFVPREGPGRAGGSQVLQMWGKEYCYAQVALAATDS